MCTLDMYIFGHGHRKGSKILKYSVAFVYGLGDHKSIFFTKIY